MTNGTVNGLTQKRFWIYSTEEGNDVFVHFSQINKQGFKTLEEGSSIL